MNALSVESLIMEYNMPGSRQSKRFASSGLMEKLVPVFLAILALVLLAVIIILALALAGIFPSVS
jgi:hypothetical protein